MNDTSAATAIDYSAATVATGNAWTQTSALLVDAYRDLQARKLFWLTLVLSLLMSVMFGFVGIDERGFSIFGKSFPSSFNSNIIPPAQFYKFLFVSLAIPMWLGFLAAVLGLIAVGGIFPDMISGGSIDLYLSRPIGRLRLFLTKYAFGLSFIALQVLLFSLSSFFVIGIRGGSWEPRVFLAVPLVTLFFSYLFCVCVLIGIVTRSTLAAILLTMLLWGGLWAVHSTDMALTSLAAAADARVHQQQRTIKFNDDLIAKNEALPPEKRGNVSQFIFQRDKQKQNLTEYEQTAADLRWWQRLFLMVKAPLPKTAETVDLMSRWLLNPEPFMEAQEDSRERRQERRAARGIPTTRDSTERLDMYMGTPDAQQAIAQEINARRATWIIGTSLGFEVVVLALASWIFCRRDY